MICDRLTCGLEIPHIQRRLLSETDLNLAKAIKISTPRVLSEATLFMIHPDDIGDCGVHVP